MVDIVPTLKTFHSLLSTNKFADVNYITMITSTAVQIYDRETTRITTSQPPVLTGWQDEISGLWHVPLTLQHNKKILQLNGECKEYV